ncbi:hypothetical protein QE152_g19073 [Popillia japonica]|uniref:Uncharacterized protein n=1 Tax=Popillia japonica TaxID=7064 RepID=A0AAW1L375_POPJA
MVVVKLKQKIRKAAPKTILKWDVNKFKDESTRESYAMKLKMLIEESDGAQENVDKEWKITKECIEQAAEETIGREKIINEKTWFNTECRIKIEEKAKARLK